MWPDAAPASPPGPDRAAQLVSALNFGTRCAGQAGRVHGLARIHMIPAPPSGRWGGPEGRPLSGRVRGRIVRPPRGPEEGGAEQKPEDRGKPSTSGRTGRTTKSELRSRVPGYP